MILDRSKNDTSILLDLLRAVAAQAVCVGHAIAFFKSDLRPAWMPYMQNVGVLIFFLLSGLVIAATLWNRSKDPTYGFLQFFIDRFARIYSGLVPALVVVLLIDGAAMAFAGETWLVPYYTPKVFVGNLLMLEGYWGVYQDHLRFAAFGSAAPLWTLAIEWHIYMFVGAIFFTLLRRGNIAVLLCIAAFFGQVALHYVTGSFQLERNVGQGLFTLWLVGFALYFLVRPIPAWTGAVIFAVACLAYLAITEPLHEYNFASYVPLAIGFAALVAASQSTTILGSAERQISFFADYSFSLYLIHHTIMYSMFSLKLLTGWSGFCVSIAISNVVAIAIAYACERHHKQLARWLRGLVSFRATSQVVG